MNTATAIHKNIGYEIMQHLHENFTGSHLYDINDKGCYQQLKLENGCSIHFTKWRYGGMPFYIVLFNNKGKYIFELDLSMIVCSDGVYDWYLKSPQNKTTFNVVNEMLSGIIKLPDEYTLSVKKLKETLSSGVNTPRNGFNFLSNASWNTLTTRLLTLVTSVFDGHGLPKLNVNLPCTTHNEANNDSNEYEAQRRRIRKGQAALKQKLLEVYDAKCCVTGCDILEILEAAHIMSHAESGINHSENALLLRADIHILFDRHLLKISPKALKITLDESLKNTEYWSLNGNRLRKRNDNKKPSFEYLDSRWSNV